MDKNKISKTQDTIVACATVQGTAALAIIRLSGGISFDIVQALFPSKNLFKQASHTLHFGALMFKNETIDEVLISLFKAPHSFTGENSVEISCHGSPLIVEQIINACLHNNARLAKAGEFTQRAFLNGKMDLTQAEAVADIIHSENKASQQNAIKNLRGGFSIKLKELRNQLIEFTALIELELDFSEEDLEFADRSKFLSLIKKLQQELLFLSNSFKWGNVLKNGIQIAIIGKPNAGKSTLLNAILNEERAIVSPIAGTTRDSIEETLRYKGLTFRFIDTAGIRQSNDEIEKIGIEKSYKKMAQADMILYLFDAKETSLSELIEQEQYFKSHNYDYILLANKIDTLQGIKLGEKLKNIKIYLPLVAKNNEGIDNVLECIYKHFANQKNPNENIILTNIRHFEAIKKIQENLSIIKQGLDQQLSGDLLSIEIKHCLHHIGQLTGQVTNEQILDYVFSKFCIGK